MLTLPTNWETWLTATACSPVMVYELELAAGTLRYSSQALTWGGNAYTALAVSQRPIIEERGPRVPECSVTFSNVNNDLQSQIEPLDLLSRRRLTVRMLLRNPGTGVLDTDSVIMFRGVMERPRRVDQNSFQITAVGLGRGQIAAVPGRQVSEWCNVYSFGDGVECNYTASTQTTGSGTGNVIPVIDAQPFVDELENTPDGISPSTIAIGADTGNVLSTADAGANTITINTSITYASGEDVVFETCPRQWEACQARAREVDYQGFPGSRTFFFPGFSGGGGSIGGFNIPPIYNPPRDVTQRLTGFEGSRKIPVPLIYGRRRTEGVTIEEKNFTYTGHTTQQKVQIALLSEGEIDSVSAWYNGNVRRISSDEEVVLSGTDRKRVGIYYRTGLAGETGTESRSDYTADPSTQLRDQKADFLQTFRQTYARTAWASLIWKSKDPLDSVQFEVKGIKCQEYTTAGAASGSPAWTTNPVWQAIDLLLNKRYGLGRILSSSDIDWPTTVDSADYCGVTVSSLAVTLNNVNGTAYSFTPSLEGFETGSNVFIDGGAYSNEPFTISEILSYNFCRIDGLNVTTPYSQYTMTLTEPRFASNIIIDRFQTVGDAIDRILRSCNGYLKWGDGKVGIGIDQSEVSSAADFRDSGATSGYGIIRDSFQWLADDPIDHEVLRVVGQWLSQEGERQEVVAHDLSAIENFLPKEQEIDLEGIDNADQAYRVTEQILRRASDTGTGAKLLVGPIGVKVQPGDVIDTTHDVPGWSQDAKRVERVERIGLGSDRDFLTALTLSDYAASVYNAEAILPWRRQRPTDETTVTLSVEGGTEGNPIVLSWVVNEDDGDTPFRGFQVYRSTATMNGNPGAGDLVYDGSTRTGRLTRAPEQFPDEFRYRPDADELGTLLYFLVILQSAGRGYAVSNEVTVTPLFTDPVSNQYEPGDNTVFGGDLREPSDWKTTSASVTAVLPTQDTGASGVTAELTSSTNAYDNDTATAAFASGVSNANSPQGSDFTDINSTGTVSGYWEVICDTEGVGFAAQYAAKTTLQYSIDGGSTWTTFAISQPVDGTKVSYVSEVVTADAANMQCRVLIDFQRPSGTVNSDVWEVRFQEIDNSAAFGEVSGDQGSIRGDGSSAYGEIWRPWPGRDPVEGGVTIPNGSAWTVQVQGRCLEGTPTHDLEVAMYHVDTDTTYVIATIDKDEIDESYASYACRWTAPTGMAGSFEFRVRTISSRVINVDKPQMEEGEQVHLFAPHREELGAEPDLRFGQRGSYPSGAWSGVKKATMS